MQALRNSDTPNQPTATSPVMGRRLAFPNEPTDLELRIRIRKWVKHFYRPREARGVLRKEYAEELGMKPATMSNLLNEKEFPGLDTLAALHYRLGADCRELLREDPPVFTSEPPPANTLPTQTRVRGRK